MVSDVDETLGPGAKRRRLRKGTHSCWECKRRKVRCSFASPTDETCTLCRRRGVKCIGQDLPEEASQTEDEARRMGRVEALLNQLVKKVDHGSGNDGLQSTDNEGRRPVPAAPTPASASESTACSSCTSISPEETPRESENAGPHQFATTTAATSTFAGPQAWMPVRIMRPNAGKYEKVSRALLAAFPPQGDIDILLKTCHATQIWCTHLRSQLDCQDPVKRRSLAEIPSPNTHPVLVARQMLIFSSFLLYVSAHGDLQQLSEHHRTIRERLFDAAVSLVTTSEGLFGSMESLECIVYEGCYHLDLGNVRRGWLAFRRAMGAAQLMGIDRARSPSVKMIDPSTDIKPQALWFRILYMDRFLSLLLGLPPGNTDVGIQPSIALANSTPSLQLERVHAGVTARILERNRMGMSEGALAMTFDIDKELLKTADSLPAKFWEPASFAGLDKNSHEAFAETMRIKDQIFHYTLLNQLHLPFLLCPHPDGKNEYSRITCVNASRDIMTRFFVFRSFNTRSACCRLADFLALIAGMTLILAHLDSHRHRNRGNLLAHQRLGDRATVEQGLAMMQVNSKLNEDMLAARCAELLKHLLDIEADAAHGQLHGSDGARGTQNSNETRPNVLLIAVPYLGTVSISREGVGLMEPGTQTSRFTQDLGASITIGGIGSVNVGSPVLLASDPVQPFVGNPISCVDRAGREIRPSAPPLQNAPPLNSEGSAFPDMMQLPSTVTDDLEQQQQDLYPGLAADMNDWVFQGVDTAFFDSLMREPAAEVAGGGVADWSQPWHSDMRGL